MVIAVSVGEQSSVTQPAYSMIRSEEGFCVRAWERRSKCGRMRSGVRVWRSFFGKTTLRRSEGERRD